MNVNYYKDTNVMNLEIFTELKQEILQFFNNAQTPSEIQNMIVDDPNFEKPLPAGIKISLAKKIIETRNNDFDGVFSSWKNIDEIKGVGPSTWHNIIISFLLAKNKNNDIPKYSIFVSIGYQHWSKHFLFNGISVTNIIDTGNFVSGIW